MTPSDEARAVLLAAAGVEPEKADEGAVALLSAAGVPLERSAGGQAGAAESTTTTPTPPTTPGALRTADLLRGRRHVDEGGALLGALVDLLS